MNPIQTDVAIVRACPAGLLLARMLQLQGIDAVVLERRSRDYVLGRVRAGIIEQPVAELLVELGVGERMLADRLVHDGVQLQHRAGDRMVRDRIDFAALTGKTVTVYGQRELVRDLIGLREADGLPLRFGAEVIGLDGLSDDRVAVRYRDEAGESTISARYVAGVDGAHGITAQLLDAAERQTLQRSYPAAWLGVLVEAAPPSHELIYARHPEGFALASMRTPEVSRLYLQVPAGDTLADWSEDRIWEQLHRRLELGPVRGEEALDVAHVGVLREQPLDQRLVGRHVGGPHHQHEVRARRHAITLLHAGVGRRALLEGGQMLGALAVQRDLDDRAQAVAQPLVRQQRHAALDHAGLHQPAHAAQCGGRRHVRGGGQVLVGQ